MALPTLDELVRLGLLQSKPPDARRVSAWLARSRRDLELATDLLAAVDRERAMAVAYEAGYRVCAGILDLEAFRITAQPGHHRAAIDAATVVLGPEHRPLLRRLDAPVASATRPYTAKVPTSAAASSASSSATWSGSSASSNAGSAGELAAPFAGIDRRRDLGLMHGPSQRPSKS